MVAVSALTAQTSRPASTSPRAQWPCFRGPGMAGVAHGAFATRWNLSLGGLGTDRLPTERGEGSEQRDATEQRQSREQRENVAYRVELPGAGASSPIVSGARVFVTCYSGYGRVEHEGAPDKLTHHLVAIDRGKGTIQWCQSLPGGLSQEASPMHRNEHGFATPTPVTDGERVYAYFGRAGLLACDGKGTRLWTADVGKPSKDAPKKTNAVERDGKVLTLRWGAAASLCLHEGRLFVNASEESNSIRAYDAASGKLLWHRESANLEGCATTPVVLGTAEDAVLVVSLAGECQGLDPATGKLLWQVETGTRGGMGPTPLAHGDVVLVFGGLGNGFAIRWRRALGTTSSQPSRVVWQGDNLGIPSPVIDGDRLILVSAEGVATCVACDTGKQLSKARLEGRTSKLYASPLIAGKHLYVVSRKRGTFVYSLPDLKLAARNELGDASDFSASPAVADGELYLRSDRALYCIRAQG